MLGTGAWQNQELPNESGEGLRSGGGDAMEGGMLMLVTCDAFESTSDPGVTAASELFRDEKLTMLAAGDGERDAATGEQRPPRGSRVGHSGLYWSLEGV